MSRAIMEAECRGTANRILDEMLVGSPEEIDVEMIAWRTGRLTIEFGGLDTADGRLLASGNGGVIRVGKHVHPEGRQRFTVAHEIGHYCLHGFNAAVDTAADMNMWVSGSKETEANLFAGELLMPERLFAALVPSPGGPSLAHIDGLAERFRTSNLAAAVHFIMHTREPCALHVAQHGKTKWFRRSRDFEFFVKAGPLHGWSAAGEIYEGKSGDTNGMVEVPAGVWLDRFEPDGRESIREDARALPSLGMVISLLWIDGEL